MDYQTSFFLFQSDFEFLNIKIKVLCFSYTENCFGLRDFVFFFVCGAFDAFLDKMFDAVKCCC